MRYSIEYQGPFEENIDRIRSGAQTYVKREGSEASVRGPANLDGIRFGLLEKAGKEFVIARVQYLASDIPLANPVTSAGIGPNGKLLSKAGALDLLNKIAVANPSLAERLKGIVETVQKSSDA